MRGITPAIRPFAVPLLLAGVVVGMTQARAAATGTRAAGPAASTTFSGELFGVAATSASNAWAVGSSGGFASARGLIVHWNGTAWAQVPNPAAVTGEELFGVAATSASSAWAVGCTRCGTASVKGLILRWNGTAWKPMPSPGPGNLSSVAATSASNAWAVGSTGTATLVLRWNGTVWTRVPSPSPGASSVLSSVTATSATNAWAVGDVYNGGPSFGGMILHWNGSAWARVPYPVPTFGQFGNSLRGVAASSASNAWAVGCTDSCPVGGTPVIARWNGTAWKQVAAPTTPYALYNLAAVAAISATNAWAVGGGGPVTDEAAAALHWNGRSWTLSPGITGAGLVGVAASSATNAWAVGGNVKGRTLILHWNGTTWKVS